MLKRKIIIMTLVVVAAVEIPLSLFYINTITSIEKQQVKTTNTIYMDFVKQDLTSIFYEAKQLALYCASDYRILNFLTYEGESTEYRGIEAFTAYETMGRFLSSSDVREYVNKLIIFNKEGVFIQADTKISGSLRDLDNIKESPLWGMDKKNFHFSKGITFNNDVVAMLLPIDTVKDSYVYLELSMDIFKKTQGINGKSLNFSLIQEYEVYLNDTFESSFLATQFPSTYDIGSEDSERGNFLYDGTTYDYDYYPIANTNFALLSTIHYGSLYKSFPKVVYMTVLVSLTSIIIAILLAVVLSTLLTKRSSLIINHINRIKEKEFSPDSAIAGGDDEFSQIGQTLNEMGVEIEALLDQTKKHYETEKKQEIALLQKQINPHFLYNTLESIYWMAVVQKSPGISKMTRALSDLLKGLAKDRGERVPLQEELSLLDSYVQILKIRYVEMFDYSCTIPESYGQYKIMRFTLQPLIENAIYHGIEPKGECGSVQVYIHWEDEMSFEIVVEDDGVGIDPETLSRLLVTDHVISHGGLNSIGLKNVDDRIKLTYGNEYGLRVESSVLVGTKVYLKLPKET